MARKLYPIGIQTFERIRKEDMFYVDKTEYIYHMTHTDGTYFFLSRPRRFGKSLLVSTFKSYFEGKKELFEGLAIEKLEKEWTAYPVLHFDLSKGKHMENEQLEEYLGYLLEDYEKKYGIENHRNGNNNRFNDLIEVVYRKTGRQVVVLIDEYDAPLLDVAHEKEKLDDLRNTMRNFYSPLKGNESMLRFVFMTGITKFSQLSIFSELNNIKNVSMDEPYAGICGITKEEMLTQMSDDIDALAEHQELSREETIEELKNHYDGYHFCWPSPDVFNPYSLLNCFADGRMDDYWFGSGTPTYLINMMRKYDFLPADLGETIEVDKKDFDAPTETMTTIVPLLYQSGYVTIKGYDKPTKLYLLALPNQEIRVGLYGSLLPHYLTDKSAKANTTIAKMSVFVKKGDMDAAFCLLNDFLETVPYCDNTNYEGHWQQTLYIMFALLTNYRIMVESHTAKGRIDITMETADAIYVMELKFNKSAEEALAQIDAKHYADAFKMSGKKVVKIGLNFSVKDEVNSLEWVSR
ncbi:MAG: ATP-binding protein [Prevotella sp.]